MKKAANAVTSRPATGSPPAEAAAEDVSASDLVFSGIVRGLETQAFVPGQRLIETDLSSRFGIGRNSVREALQRLAAEGVVDLLRHRGAVIRLLTEQETQDVLDVAERMTALLARTAVRGRNHGGRAQALRRAVKDLERADEAHDAEAFASARRHFYRALLDMGDSRELRRLFPSIHMPIVYAQHRLPTLQKLRLVDYRRIAGAVLAGDADAADREGALHVRNVRDAIAQAAAARPTRG